MDRDSRSRFFTPTSADRALPLVEAITRDVVVRAREYYDRQQRLDLLLEGRDRESQDPYLEELSQVESELQEQAEVLQGFVDELSELGVELKHPLEGLVDFPAWLDGRQVYLCWKLGEDRVRYWHDAEAGFAGRQPTEGLAWSDVDAQSPSGPPLRDVLSARGEG